MFRSYKLTTFSLNTFSCRHFKFWGKKSQNNKSNSTNSLSQDKSKTSLSYYSLDPKYLSKDKEIPILMYHHMFTSKDMYQTIVKTLAEKTGRTIYLLDMRNHGESVHSGVDHSDINFIAKDVRDFMDEFKIDRAVLAGHGVGGLAMLRMSLLFGNRVDKVIAFDMTPVDQILFGSRVVDRMYYIVSALPNNINVSYARLIVKENLSRYFRDKTLLMHILMNLKKQPNGYVKWTFNLPVIRQLLIKGIDRLNIYDNKYSGNVWIVNGKHSSMTANNYSKLKESFPNSTFKFEKHFHQLSLHPSKSQQFVNTMISFINKQSNK
ncbi:protein ABHD11-like [Oppia nitens]|uniref:protein ABHD11-like n=1 Tax=Oppia nitens TaxID=1686743 RepID=UPI0023DB61A8|nr:protein ABHD11-like [Oppia nitens]